MRGNLEIEVAQNLWAEPIAQSDIFEPDHMQLRSMGHTTAAAPTTSRALKRVRPEPRLRSNFATVVRQLWFPIR